MNARYFRFLVLHILPAFFLGVALVPASQTSSGAMAESSKEICLKCHGPFDKLAELTSQCQAPSGEMTTPHRHVPHDSIDEKTIPECELCHQRHPLPPTADDLATLKNKKPDFEYCYKCHHIKDFTSCKTCHQE